MQPPDLDAGIIALGDRLHRHLLARFPADRAYPRGALYAQGMPPLVASLLGRTLDRWIERELDQLDSDWFDFGDPGVRTARGELVVALGRTARVPQAAWADTLGFAVGLVVRHLVEPVAALTDATFEGEPDPLPTATVRARLRTFEAYPYLAEIADAFFAQKQPETVEPGEFGSLLRRIDGRVTADYQPADWLRLLSPLFGLVRHLPTFDGVPAPLLALFFDAKGQDAVAERLRAEDDAVLDETAVREALISVTADGETEDGEAVARETGVAGEADPEPAAVAAMEAPAEADDERGEERPTELQVTGDADLTSLPAEDGGAEEEEDVEVEPVAALEAESELEGAESATEDPVGEPEPVGQPEAEEPEALPEESGDELDSEPDAEGEPLWKRFVAGDGQPDAPPGASSLSGDHASGPLWQRFFDGLRTIPPAAPPSDEAAELERMETTEPTPAPLEGSDLDALERRVLGRASARRRRRFVRDLFGGDGDAYAKALRALDATESWTEASGVIARDVFRPHGVDIYSAPAVEFTDAVQARFGG